MKLVFWEKKSMQRYIESFPKYFWFRIIDHCCNKDECWLCKHNTISSIECSKCKLDYFIEDYIDEDSILEEDNREKNVKYILTAIDYKCECGNIMWYIYTKHLLHYKLR